METVELEGQHVHSLSSLQNKLTVKDFVWSKNEWPTINYDNFEIGDDIPVISLSNTLNGERSEVYTEVCKDLVSACGKWGFFKLVDHGVPTEIIENMVKRSEQLFDLPMEEKMRGARSSSLPLGYSASNLDYGHNLPWAEILQLLQPPQQVIAFSKKVFGDHHHGFSDALTEYMEAMEGLGMAIFEMLAHGLGLERDFFTKNFQVKEENMIRVNRYPPCPLPEKCLGLGSHSDPHTLTILLQDEVGGLQVLKDGNQWLGIRPIPNSFIVNIGDTLEAWTNGSLKSVVHRAVVNKEKKRLSIAYFLSPNSSAIIDCPQELIDQQKSGPRRYVPFTWEDFKNELLAQRRVVGKTALNRYLLS